MLRAVGTGAKRMLRVAIGDDAAAERRAAPSDPIPCRVLLRKQGNVGGGGFTVKRKPPGGRVSSPRAFRAYYRARFSPQSALETSFHR